METQTPLWIHPCGLALELPEVKTTSGNKHELGLSPGCIFGRWSLSSYLSTSAIIQAVTLTAQLL